MSLFADRLFRDPRLSQAKKLLEEALYDATREITSVRPPLEGKKLEYEALVEAFQKIRGTPLFYPYIGSGIGNGPLVELLDGSVKFDLISGIGPHYFGHSHRPLVPHLIDAVMSDVVIQGNLQQTRPLFELASLLVELSGLNHCFVSTSGAMACENSLKVCFQKKQPAYRVLSFSKCFAGRTLALSTITDKPAFRQGLPSVLAVDYIPFFDHTRPEESTRRAVEALKTHIARYPKQHAVMCIELVQGEGGFWTAPREFFLEIINILKESGIAVWIDEIQTFARTESLFAFKHFGLEGLVDVVSIGKVSLACATLFTEEFCPKPGLLSQTFSAATTAVAAALFTIRHAQESGFFGPHGKIAEIHNAFIAGLSQYKEVLTGPYGLGAMIACTPFGGDTDKVRQLARRLFDNGVLSFIAAEHPTRLRFLPPVGVFELAHIDPVMQIIGKSL